MKRIMSFGPTYIIPKPLDPRLLSTVAPAVAKQRLKAVWRKSTSLTGTTYAIELNKRLGLDNQLIRVLGNKARKRSETPGVC